MRRHPVPAHPLPFSRNCIRFRGWNGACCMIRWAARGPAKRQNMTIHPTPTHPFPCRRRRPAASGHFRFPNRRAYGMTLGIKGSPLSRRRACDDSIDTALTRLSMKRNDQTSPAWATVSHRKSATSERALWRVFGMFLFQGAWSCLLHGTFPGRVFPFSIARGMHQNPEKGEPRKVAYDLTFMSTCVKWELSGSI